LRQKQQLEKAMKAPIKTHEQKAKELEERIQRAREAGI